MTEKDMIEELEVILGGQVTNYQTGVNETLLYVTVETQEEDYRKFRHISLPITKKIRKRVALMEDDSIELIEEKILYTSLNFDD